MAEIHSAVTWFNCTEPFYITFQSSSFDSNTVQKAVKWQVIHQLPFITQRVVGVGVHVVLAEMRCRCYFSDVDGYINIIEFMHLVLLCDNPHTGETPHSAEFFVVFDIQGRKKWQHCE